MFPHSRGGYVDLPKSIQLLEECLRRAQIRRPEAFRKSLIDWLQKGASLGEPPAFFPQPRQARRGPQLPGERTLLARPVKRREEQLLGLRRSAPIASYEKKLALDA
jgi:hypothetical protein